MIDVDFGVKSRRAGAVHYIHPEHPGVAFCGADVTLIHPASPLANRPTCVMCRFWYARRADSATQDDYWTEDRLRAEGRPPFNTESTDEDVAEWRAQRAESAARRSMHPRELIALYDSQRG